MRHTSRFDLDCRRLVSILVLVFAFPCVSALSARDFVRGRINDDAGIDISDPVFLLVHLFSGGPAPECEDAADGNDDGTLDISDAVYLLAYLFTGGPVVPSPFPDPGPDPTPDDLTCGIPTELVLEAAPSPLSIVGPGAVRQLQVTGTGPLGTVDLTGAATGTRYGASPPGIVYAYRDGLIEGLRGGSTVITIENDAAEHPLELQVTVGSSLPSSEYRVFAANDLGMHCIDRDFSVFSILPLFNVVRAQVVRVPSNGETRLVGASEVDVRFSPAVDATGSFNSSSIDKTGFWTYVPQLFGADLPPGQGLLGLYMPADAPDAGPQLFAYNAATELFTAVGVPIVDRDDAGTENPYPLLRISAVTSGTDAILASVDAVVPVSSETDCQGCHRTGEIAARDPEIAWDDDSDVEIQTRRNILILHDHEHDTHLADETPVLCARCHYSRALDLSGAGPQGEQVDRSTFSQAMHLFHSTLENDDGEPLFPEDGDSLTTCYQCHPGRITDCQRGAMRTGGMVCRNCHSGMHAVGGGSELAAGGSLDGENDGGIRRPWFDMPRCQSCHTGDALTHLSGSAFELALDGIRLKRAWREGDLAASPILSQSSRFAEEPHTLYRESFGHGGIACEHCHGSTHAIWPNEDAAANDNVASVSLQGHSGTITDCDVCHARRTLPMTLAGPHGMHNVNDSRWTDDQHEDFFERNPSSCRACHGAQLQGTVLARAAADRSYRVEDRTVHVAKGTQIRCNLCHGMPQ